MNLALANIWGFIVANKKVIGWLVIGLIFILGSLFLADRYSTWKGNRDVNRLRANVNLASQELRQAQDSLAKDRVLESSAVARVAEATNVYLEAVNASTEARRATNEAIKNLRVTVNANIRSDVQAMDLERRINEIEVR